MKNIFDWFGNSVCHQLSERSIFIKGIQLPVCARCTGIYMGVAVSVLFLIFGKRIYGNKAFNKTTAFVLAMSLLPFMIDGFCSYSRVWETNNFVRIVTGSMAGYAMPIILLLVLNFDPKTIGSKYILKSGREAGMVLFASVAIGIFVILGGFKLYFITSFIICCSIVFVYTGVLAVMYSGIFKKNIELKRLIFNMLPFGFCIIIIVNLLKA